jgi:protein phosphatase 1 regulatory subunit 37
MELIVSALGTIPPSLPPSNPGSGYSTPVLEKPELKFQPSDKPQLVSLRMDGCNLRPAALEALAHAVRNSPLQHISLRNNRIASPAGVALALMIKDYPDTVPTSNGSISLPSSPGISHQPLLSPPPTPRTFATPSTPTKPNAPHPSAVTSVSGTTYTPYIPRSKRVSVISVVNAPASPTADREERQVPRFSTSQGGGVTTRHLSTQTPSEVVSAATTAARNAGPSAALLDKVRALDNLPRLGALKTLDLRGNDLRVRRDVHPHAPVN